MYLDPRFDDPSRTADHGYFANEQHEPVTLDGAMNDMRYGHTVDDRTASLVIEVSEDLFADLSNEQLRKLLCLMLDSSEFSELVRDRVQDYVNGF